MHDVVGKTDGCNMKKWLSSICDFTQTNAKFRFISSSKFNKFSQRLDLFINSISLQSLLCSFWECHVMTVTLLWPLC